jgi:hypothetical protein
VAVPAKEHVAAPVMNMENVPDTLMDFTPFLWAHAVPSVKGTPRFSAAVPGNESEALSATTFVDAILPLDVWARHLITAERLAPV